MAADRRLRYAWFWLRRVRCEQLERELADVGQAHHDLCVRWNAYEITYRERADRLAAALRDIAIEVVAARKTLDAHGTLDRISEIVGAALKDEPNNA